MLYSRWNQDYVSWLVGLGVWFSLRVREVPGSNPGRALVLIAYSISYDITAYQLDHVSLWRRASTDTSTRTSTNTNARRNLIVVYSVWQVCVLLFQKHIAFIEEHPTRFFLKLVVRLKIDQAIQFRKMRSSYKNKWNSFFNNFLFCTNPI